MRDDNRQKEDDEEIAGGFMCLHEWEWRIDLNNQRFGVCKKCKAVNDDYRTPEITI